tara:strand:+ start:2159 stop:3247 length:1089 start_codon:yes stop_codon:yes gene_type:complete
MAKRGRPRKVSEIIEEEMKEDLPTQEEVVEDITDAEEVIETPQPKHTPPPSDSNVVGEGTFGDHNPFAENVIEREYSTPKVASGVVEDIDEPTFMPPTYEDVLREQEGGEVTQEQLSQSPFENPNPALNDLDNKDKKIACESLVDTCLDAYEQLHQYGQYVIKVDEDELMQKQAQGKIDLEEIIPVTENGDTMSVGEFIGQFNQQSAEALKYDKEFGYKVRPAMIRVFMKKGWGMTDEQYLMYMFGKDIAVKVGIMYQLKKSINSTIATLEKAHSRKTQESKGYSAMYEETIKSSPIEENEPILQAEQPHVEEEKPEIVVEQTDNFTDKMNINMPQNPKDPMAEHPKEIRKEIVKGGRKKKK